jgi:hypothetical protein
MTMAFDRTADGGVGTVWAGSLDWAAESSLIAGSFRWILIGRPWARLKIGHRSSSNFAQLFAIWLFQTWPKADKITELV